MAGGKKIKTFIIRLLHLGSELPPIVSYSSLNRCPEGQSTYYKETSIKKIVSKVFNFVLFFFKN